MKDSIRYWLDLADYDLESAKVMLNGGRYLYVGFMCHQTVEKALKAVISSDLDGELPPKIHHLLKLADCAGIYNKMNEEQQTFIKNLNPLNVEARYPAHSNNFIEGLSIDICNELIQETEKMLCWIKQQL